MTNVERGAALVGPNARGLIATRVIVPRPAFQIPASLSLALAVPQPRSHSLAASFSKSSWAIAFPMRFLPVISGQSAFFADRGLGDGTSRRNAGFLPAL